jgi:hypothetical protein
MQEVKYLPEALSRMSWRKKRQLRKKKERKNQNENSQANSLTKEINEKR